MIFFHKTERGQRVFLPTKNPQTRPGYPIDFADFAPSLSEKQDNVEDLQRLIISSNNFLIVSIGSFRTKTESLWELTLCTLIYEHNSAKNRKKRYS